MFERGEHDRKALDKYRKRDEDFIQRMLAAHDSDKTEIAALRSRISILENSLREAREDYNTLFVSRRWSKFYSVVGGFIMAFGAVMAMTPKAAWLVIAGIMILGPVFFEGHIRPVDAVCDPKGPQVVRQRARQLRMNAQRFLFWSPFERHCVFTLFA